MVYQLNPTLPKGSTSWNYKSLASQQAHMSSLLGNRTDPRWKHRFRWESGRDHGFPADAWFSFWVWWCFLTERECVCLKWESVGSFRWGFVFRVFIWEFLGRLGPFCIDLIMLSIIKLVRFLTIYIYTWLWFVCLLCLDIFISFSRSLNYSTQINNSHIIWQVVKILQ